MKAVLLLIGAWTTFAVCQLESSEMDDVDILLQELLQRKHVERRGWHWKTRGWTTRNWPTQNWPTQGWPTQGLTTQSWATQGWTTKNWPTQGWTTKNWPTQGWTMKNWPTQGWATQGWTTKNWPTQGWATQGWTTKNWPTQGWTTKATDTDCKRTEKGLEYTGRISTTSSGLTCQAWSSQHPHKHKMVQFDSDNGVNNAANYCRNPGGVGLAPWCYTINPKRRFEYCSIPKCDDKPEDCKRTEQGMDYTGHINRTPSGATCQEWSSQHPHKHNIKDFASDGGIRNAHNYCRNPGGVAWLPWCYTTNPGLRWEYCDIPKCESFGPDCKKTIKGLDYNGTINITPSGNTCQPWTSQYPHKHSLTNDKFDGGIESARNYCRNPNGAWMPWCYTNNPNLRWEYCNIPLCEKDCMEMSDEP